MLLLLLLLLRRLMKLGQVLLSHVKACAGQRTSPKTGEYDRNKVWGDAALYGFSKHGLLNAPLLQAKLFLPSLLFFLPPLVLLCFGT